MVEFLVQISGGLWVFAFVAFISLPILFLMWFGSWRAERELRQQRSKKKAPASRVGR
jgi:hypothetical protein